jgi:signal transduction histidine kinase
LRPRRLPRKRGGGEHVTGARRRVILPFVRILLPGIVLLASIALVLTWQHVRRHRDAVAFEESHVIGEQQIFIARLCNSIVSDVLAIASQHEIEAMADEPTPEQRRALELELQGLALHKRIYDQIRYISADGREQVRINYRDGRATIVPDEQLQQKTDRYYFRGTMALGPGQIFASPLDLNIEHGEIEQPLLPMLRIGTPVFGDDGRAFGMVIVNYKARDLLRPLARIGSSSIAQVMLLNSDGYFLKGLDPADEFGFMYPDGGDRTMGARMPAAWDAIIADEQGFLDLPSGYFAFTTIRPFGETSEPVASALDIDGHRARPAPVEAYAWKLVSFLSREEIDRELQGFAAGLALPALLVLLLFVIGSWRLAVAVDRRQEAEQALRETNAELERRVVARTAALMETSAALNAEIRDKIEAVLARKEIEDRLASTEGLRALGAVSAGIAHDFNNILTPIMGFTEMAMFDAPDGGPVHDHLDHVLGAAARGQELIEQVLSFSGRGYLDLQETNPAVIVREVAVQLGVTAPENVAIRLDLPRETPTITADAGRLHRTLLNLGRNAVQAMAERGGRLTYGIQWLDPGADMTAPRVRISVTDTGPGIPDEALERIFEPYFTTKARKGGTGLGLASSQTIVRRHGGTLGVASTLGEGTTFTVILPQIPPLDLA